MSTKLCPNCGAEVPSVANLCKHCFHDFNMVVAKKKSPWFTLLTLAASTAIVAAIAFSYIHSQSRTFKISVNKETEQIVFVTKYADHTESDTVPFRDVSAVEYVMNARPRPFEIAILTTRGERHVYQQGDEPLDLPAAKLGEFLGKPVVTKDLYDRPAVIEKKE